MSNDPRNPDVGDLTIDASNLAPVVVDLPPGGRLGLRVAQPGCADAVAEIRSNQPRHGVDAGIRDEDVVALEQAMARIDEIDGFLPPVRKLLELLEESRAVLDDSVQRRITMIASTVEQRARMLRSDDLLARYAGARSYRSAVAQKALRTRLRNQAGGVSPDEPAGGDNGDDAQGFPGDAGSAPGLDREVSEALADTTGELSADALAATGSEASQG